MQQDDSGAARARETLRYVGLGGLAFGVAMGLVLRATTGSWELGLHGGFFGGFAFGWGLRKFLQVSTSSPALELDGRDASFEAGEVVARWGPANHFVGVEAVGGKLFLTDRRLRFRAHALNVQAHDSSYGLSTIVSVEPSRTLGLVPNGLVVTLADGRVERFVVMGRGAWVEALRAATSGGRS